MRLDRAQSLKIGQIVGCPADRGDVRYTGKVTHIGTEINKSFSGVEFVWVTVEHPNGKSRHVWPSNRLG